MLAPPTKTHRRSRSAIVGWGGGGNGGGLGCMPGFGCIAPRAGTLSKVGDSQRRNKGKAAGTISNGTVNRPQNQYQLLLFPTAYESATAQKREQQPLSEQLEECVCQAQMAICELERLRETRDVLAEIRADFEYGNENGDEDGDGTDADGNEGKMQFVDKFVAQVRTFYELARRIETMVPSVLEVLCSGCHAETMADMGDDAELQRNYLIAEQLLSKNFAKLLDVAIRFDVLKAATPALQNGFSMYRRLDLLKNFGSNPPQEKAPTFYAGDHVALFLSRPFPFLISVVNGAELYIGRQPSRELAMAHLGEALLVIYNVLKYTLERRHQLNGFHGQKQQREEENSLVGDFLLRAMAGILLLFDHVEVIGGGVFCNCGGSSNPFDIAEFVALVRRHQHSDGSGGKQRQKVLTNDEPNGDGNNAVSNEPQQQCQQQHLAILRFMSRHFNDPEVPSHVRRLFEFE